MCIYECDVGVVVEGGRRQENGPQDERYLISFGVAMAAIGQICSLLPISGLRFEWFQVHSDRRH
jgi:hypothetical protein